MGAPLIRLAEEPLHFFVGHGFAARQLFDTLSDGRQIVRLLDQAPAATKPRMYWIAQL